LQNNRKRVYNGGMKAIKIILYGVLIAISSVLAFMLLDMAVGFTRILIGWFECGQINY